MTENLTLTLIIAGVVLLALALPCLLLLKFAEYRLGRHEVEVLVFDRVIRRIMLSEIDDVVVGCRLPCEFWPARWIWRGRFLSIRKKHGIFRYLVICPKYPDRLRANIYFALGWNPHGPDAT